MRIPDGFLDNLGKWFNEASGFVSYVGDGKDEAKEYQEFVDISNQSKRLCFKGHSYSALERFCPECTITKDVYIVFKDGEFSGYHSVVKEKNVYLKFRDVESKALWGKLQEEELGEEPKKLTGRVEQ